MDTIRTRHGAIRIAAVIALLFAAVFLSAEPRGTVAHADTYTETASIKAIFIQVPMAPVGGFVFPPQTFVSFQTETPDGEVVMTQPGDSSVNFEAEGNSLQETPKRRGQVDRLRAAMAGDGWIELGVAGEWFEYSFGR